jgi:thiamine pyrophosphate-dependent acetolactate synthase large subunit-like protein
MDLAEGHGAAAEAASPPPAAPRPQAIERRRAVVRQSRKPVIVAGLGAHRAGAKAALEQLADRIGALLVTSARGKDMFRGHPAISGSSARSRIPPRGA